ncbi:MAG: hypothetical protein M3394_09685, partial [Actinomycetota bacterium]|nr:hypothetical protein [Actinomycetota bacterium]
MPEDDVERGATSPRRAPRRKGRLFTALVVAALAAAPVGTGRAEPAYEELPAVGKWRPTVLPPGQSYDVYFPSVQAAVDSSSRLLYAIRYDWIAAYDLDTLQPRGEGYQPEPGVHISWFVDSRSATLFVAFTAPNNQSVRLDRYESTPAGVRRLSSVDLTARLAGGSVMGMYRPPGTDALYLLAERPPTRGISGYQAGGGVTVAELSTGDRAAVPRVDWTVDLPGCWAPMTYKAPAALGFVPSQGALYFGCSNGKPPSIGSLQPLVPRGIGRLELAADPSRGPTPLPDTTRFTLFPHSGQFKESDSVFDSGGDRLLFGASDTSGYSLFGFDARSNAYVGAVSAGSGNVVAQSGIDPVIGRYYGIIPSSEPGAGLVLSDVRTTPLSQGRNFPALHHHPDAGPSVFGAASNGVIAVDPPRRRVFVKYGSDQGFYMIFEDRIPPFVPSPPDDPDAATVDVEERPGVTRAAYNSSVQAYGARFRQIGGATAVVKNATPQDGPALGANGASRELRTAYLSTLRAGDAEASAGAVSLDADPATRANV